MSASSDPRHRKFLRNLSDSQEAVAVVAEWLRGKGHLPRVPELTLAPEHRDWRRHADAGDIYLQVDGVDRRVEVKRLSRDFQGRHSWPFGRKFIVCAKHAWDNANPKPHAYIILNRAMTIAAIVKADTSAHWYVESRKDARYSDAEEYRQEFYLCPLGQVAFNRIRAESRAAA